MKLRSENLQRFRARVRFMQQLYACGAIGPDEVGDRIRAWLAHARHGHTRALCRHVLQDLAFCRPSLDDS